MQKEGGRGRTTHWCCHHDVSTPEAGIDPLFEAAGWGQTLSETPRGTTARLARVSVGRGGGQGRVPCTALQNARVMEFLTQLSLRPLLFL